MSFGTRPASAVRGQCADRDKCKPLVRAVSVVNNVWGWIKSIIIDKRHVSSSWQWQKASERFVAGRGRLEATKRRARTYVTEVTRKSRMEVEKTLWEEAVLQ